MNRIEERLWRLSAGDIYLGEKEDGGGLYISRKDLDTHAHFLGPSGTGKTRALQLLIEQLIDSEDCSVVVVDPHDGRPPFGGLYHAMKSHCYDRGHQDRLVLFDPWHYEEHRIVTGFNPLSRGRSPIVRAGLAVEHLRAIIGQGGQFSASPMLARWGFNTFLGLIASDLAMADAYHLLNLADPSYREALAHILAADYPDVASDWEWLVHQEGKTGRAREIIDDKLGSTTTRLRMYTTTEVLRSMLSTREHVLDPHEILRERKVLLANLNTRGVMMEADQRMLGIQLVHSICRAAMEREDPDGPPCYLIIDEFSKFITPEVLEILDGTRKFGLHLILAHQTLTQLQDVAAQDWRYYQSVLTNARLRVVFGGLSDTDTDTMARHLYGAHLDPDRIKQEIHRTIQTSQLEWMTLRSFTTATGTTEGYGDGASQGRTDGTMSSTSRSWAGLGPANETFSYGYNIALSAGTSSSYARSESRSQSETVARTPVVVPTVPRLELGSREFMSLEEQLYRYAKKLRGQPNQHAILQVRGDYPVAFNVANVPDPDYTMDELVGPDRDLLLSSSWAATVEVIAEESRARDEAFRHKFLPSPSVPSGKWAVSGKPKQQSPLFPTQETTKRRRKSTRQIKKADQSRGSSA